MPRRLSVLLSLALACAALTACGSSSDNPAAPPVCTAHTDACRTLLRVEKQTREYEAAGASHRESACLAAVMARVKPPKGKGTSFVIADQSVSRDMARCHIRQSSLDKITKWVDARLRASHEGPYATTTSSSP